jgi:hypothetical protein
MTAERMTPKVMTFFEGLHFVMTVPDDTLCVMQKAHGNPQAF